MNRGPLDQEASRVLTDIVLLRMVAHQHILGPYRPCRPLVRGLINRLRFLWRI